jgi:hypothetical protein
MTAPTIAEIKRIDATSNGSKNSVNNILPTAFAEPKPSCMGFRGLE